MRHAFLLCLVVACGGTVTVFPGADDDGSGGAGNLGAAGTTSVNAGGAPVTTTVSTTTNIGGIGPVGGGPPFCAASLEPVTGPVDVIVAAHDNSFQGQVTTAIEQNLYASFAAVLEGAGVDVQIILVGPHGPQGHEMCIGPPLASPAGCNGPPGEVAGKFHHYDVLIGWAMSLCRLLDTFGGDVADEWSLHPQGWQKWLRAGAEKAFVVLSGSGTTCFFENELYDDQNDAQPNPSLSVAADVAEWFDGWLLSQAPAQFGSVAERNYTFHSAIGITAKPGPMPHAPYGPGEPLVPTSCANPQGIASSLQWLSKGTGGARYSGCTPQSYDALFLDLAARITQAATDPCRFELSLEEPAWPYELVLEYVADGPAEIWTDAYALSNCGGGEPEFYREGDEVVLCPAACAKVEASPNATLQPLCTSISP